MVSQQVRDCIPCGLTCDKTSCPYYIPEDDFCQVMGEKTIPEYKLCGINEKEKYANSKNNAGQFHP
jgi:hypothetical protein